MAGSERHDEERAESRRILDRVSQEAEAGGRGVIDRAADRAHHHLAASDVDQSDWAEYWGTRIGRTMVPCSLSSSSSGSSSILPKATENDP